ncbi:MAG: endoglucanase [Lachnospiraceae bacterium]
MQDISYEYHNLPIPGGGYVTGFVFHKKQKGILYCRTDIGGVYRFDYEKQSWKSLIDHVTTDKLDETFPIAIALDDQNPDRIYIACGVWEKGEGTLAVSEDRGEHFNYYTIPVPVHGNLNGRGTGMRLVVSQKDPNTLYFASQQSGFLISHDRGQSWTVRDVCGEEYLTFVFAGPEDTCLVVGTAGVVTRISDRERGHSLYVSYDQGESFQPLEEPAHYFYEESRMSGLVAQRYDYDGKYLYVTFSNTGKHSYVVENGYSCDSGDALGGKVVRYDFLSDGKISSFEEITPNAANTVLIAQKNPMLEDEILFPIADGERDHRHGGYNFGFSGISSCESQPGLLILSTICRDNGDKLYLSMDYGENWQVVLHDLGIGNMHFHAPYMKKEYNGGHSLIHWLSDAKINPFCPDEVWFNSGTGVFRSENLLQTDRSFSDCCTGIEETVHLNVYSPVAGAVQCIDIVGDLGGFAFEDVDKPCENSFADENGNRYITCINADFSDEQPETVIVTPRGNWTGKTKGGLILSTDQCKTFTRLPMPFGISDYLDEKLKGIERPNVNSGWVAMSPDTQNIVWSVADMIMLPIAGVIHSHDRGKTFAKVRVYDLAGEEVTVGRLKVFSDRMDSELFYGFGEHSRMYVSRDGGATFYQKNISVSFPDVEFGIIDTQNKTEIRGEAGKCGVFYMAVSEGGLWKYRYDKEKDEIRLQKLSKGGDIVYRVGLGLLSENSDYRKDDKALYICGTVEGEYGFYRSFDEMKTVERINTDSQMFGEINSIDGDCRTFGRFFIATGSRGVLYGIPSAR